jgi:hypothetical protein
MSSSGWLKERRDEGERNHAWRSDVGQSEQTVVWNLGAIAATGGESARTLFRDVIIASSSIPGVFPPVMIAVSDANGVAYQEMHVDGGVTVPFFIAPESVLVAPDQPQGPRGETSM